ncbi:MAG: hypothetical protein ACLQGP_36815 [Isosphaeraceae bacterium]
MSDLSMTDEMTASELGPGLGLTPGTLVAKAVLGEVRGRKVGDLWLFRRAEVMEDLGFTKPGDQSPPKAPRSRAELAAIGMPPRDESAFKPAGGDPRRGESPAEQLARCNNSARPSFGTGSNTRSFQVAPPETNQ